MVRPVTSGSSIRWPLSVLAVCWISFIALVTATRDRLPLKLATHFRFDGAPDGWMARDSHVLGTLALGLGLPVLILGIFAALRAFNGAGCNIPHRDYWLAPERRAATMNFILRMGIWLACLMVLFPAAMHLAVLRANSRIPVALPAMEFALMIAPFVAGVALWIASLLRRFLKKGDE